MVVGLFWLVVGTFGFYWGRTLMTDRPGPATDREGYALPDPTKNVLDLVEAAIARQDDLREAESQHMREILELRAEIIRAGADYEAKMREQEHKHDQDMRDAEAKRLDAIRNVDQQTALGQAKVTVDTAEALRSRVDAAAVATAGALVIALDPIRKDIADLRQSQYEVQGAKNQNTESGLGTRGWILVLVGILGLVSAFTLGVTGIVMSYILRR